MASPRPPVVVDVAWVGDLRFEARTAATVITVDSDGRAGPSPVQTLAIALAGCMATDVVHILIKGRQPLKSLRAHLVADRAPADPHRLTHVDLRFSVAGEVPRDRLQRAIELSRETYCSVWHSLRPDIEFTTSVEIEG